MVGRRLSPGEARRSEEAGDWVIYSASAKPAELAKLDAMVARLKSAGLKNMTRSRLIRLAVSMLDADALIASLIR